MGPQVSWSGKALGGLFGALVGGPVGAGVGAAVGHYLGDAARPERPLELVRLGWVHHAFRASGPGVVLTPTWRARGLVDVDVTVRIDVPGTCATSVVTPDHPVEEIDAPACFIPYSSLPQAEHATVVVTLRGRQGEHDREEFVVPLPQRARRLGNSGPGRVVMGLVACARAGSRPLTDDDVAYIRERFLDGQALDAGGEAWLSAWIAELESADVHRLGADRVAARIAVHVDALGAERVLTWLMHGTRASWPGESAEEFIDDLARELGVAARLDPLWERVNAEPDPVALARAAAVLGVAPGTDVEQARRAYRALVLRWHPDKARSPVEAASFTAHTAALNVAWALYSRATR